MRPIIIALIAALLITAQGCYDMNHRQDIDRPICCCCPECGKPCRCCDACPCTHEQRD